MATIREITTNWTTAAGGGFVTVMYFESGIAVATQRTALQAYWTANAAGLSNQTSWNISTSGKEVDDATGALTGVWSESSTKSGTGAFAGQPVSDATQALVQWRTSTIVNGRFLKGRTFIPGMAAATLASGNLSPASSGPMQTGANAFIASAAGLVVWHRPTAGSGGSHTAVSTALVQSEFAVLRRRRR